VNFYNAMVLFSKKHKNVYGSFFPNWLLFFVICLMGTLNILSIIVKNSPVFLADLFCANAFIPIVAYVHGVIFQKEFVYLSQTKYILVSHLILTATFLVALYATKHYGNPKPQINITQKTVALILVIIFAIYYAIHQEYAYSRIIIFPATILSAISLVAWRMLVSPFSKFHERYFTGYGNVVLLAEGSCLNTLVEKFDAEINTQIIGIATVEDLDEIIVKYPSVNSLIIGSKANWYPTVIKLLSQKKLKGISIFWLSPDNDTEIIRSF
jgi:FlaA1/EpsC-like NDP-sugar epimerase